MHFYYLDKIGKVYYFINIVILITDKVQCCVVDFFIRK